MNDLEKKAMLAKAIEADKVAWDTANKSWTAWREAVKWATVARGAKIADASRAWATKAEKKKARLAVENSYAYFPLSLKPAVETVATDAVNHPPHYTAGAVECIDAIAAATTGLHGVEAVCTGAAIKYLWRWKLKGGAQDLEKARWYINKLLGET